jgi:MFS family permease
MDNKIWNNNFIMLTLSNFLMCITYYSIISALPIYLVGELHAGKTQVGMVLAAYTIASVLIRPFSGFALDKYGRRSIFLLALTFYTFFFAGYLVAISIATLIILRFVQGITWGVATISGSTIAVDIIPISNRGEGLGYFGLSTTLGMSIGPVVGLFICHHWGYIAMFVSGCVISLSSLVCAYIIHLPKRFRVGRKIHFDWNHLFYHKALLPSLDLFIIMFTYGGLISFIALYGREIGIINSSLFFLIFSLGIGISRLASGKSFDKNGPGRILTICLVLLIIGFPVLAFITNAAGFYVSAVIIGFGIGVVFPTFQAIVNNLSDADHRGAANSTLYTALDTGMGLGMIVAGLVAEKYSISAVFIMNAIVCAMGLIFLRVFVLNYYERNRKVII